ncbi:HigA family addiction module antitoxin [Rubrimonas sp.]|uniref:HigA family addiction module antitoxin n=1 Tax=Rubrimonas sp. TaxID=2036015 RepID=UPI002FDCDD33
MKGETGVTADTAMRLARFFGTTPEYWMNLQRGWDLARAREAIDVSDITPLAAA